VRQFGPNKSATVPLPLETSLLNRLDKDGYAVIPPSGTFRDLIDELDFIIGELGCRILLLLPIHPTPTTYGRMGRFGSPYAALSFTAVDPALAEFDPHATPLEQFIDLVNAVHQRNAKILIDIAINHTGWAASLHETHPHWLVRDPAGRIAVPGAWGVRWEDLTQLNYTHKDLWRYMADVFLKWCGRGVDGFRCDAGYMVPLPAWKYITAKIREQYPDTIFLLEGLGGKISATRELLNSANLNWAYSELFQNYDRGQIENYLPEAIEISNCMRTALSALYSHQGAYGFANGVEWYATKKINIHDAPSLNWGAQNNQVRQIRQLNHLLKVHPAFHDHADLKIVQQNTGNYIVLLRHHVVSGKMLLVVINLDDQHKTRASWNPVLTGTSGMVCADLLTETEVIVAESDGQHSYFLEPGQVLCLSPDVKDLDLIRNVPDQSFLLPERIESQRLRAKALEVFTFYHGTTDLENFNVEQAIRQIKQDPLAFCASFNPASRESRVVTWQWPSDFKREVMIPPDHFLLVRADHPFRAQLLVEDRVVGYEEGLSGKDGVFFALFSPGRLPETGEYCKLKLWLYSPHKCRHVEAKILALPRPEELRFKNIYNRTQLRHHNFIFLDTNGCGGMLRVPLSREKSSSRYDSLLAANLSREFPEDRWIMFARCRAWLVFQGYSQEINTDCLDAFSLDDRLNSNWQYHIPTGQGEHVIISISIAMVPGENVVRINFFRHPAGHHHGRLSDSNPIKLILRPDIENRNFHETTKAYAGPEHQWPGAVTSTSTGFVFTPDEKHSLNLNISKGSYVREPEWHYMVHRSLEAERGLDPDSDLFSPGYFNTLLEGDRGVTLSAEINPGNKPSPENRSSSHSPPVLLESEQEAWRQPVDVLKHSLRHYIVNRGPLKSVIAGYPWFLDWGRDALIFVRGLISAKNIEAAQAILKQFGRFEKHGTLPNMIQGDHAGNRDTSDAQLWFIVACADLIRMQGSEAFLDQECDGRSVRQILVSIAQSIISGTPNGIQMDPESGLVFSPAHFSWMDTNHPAGTPREGYPIEIQCLWYAALNFLFKIDPTENKRKWEQLHTQVRTSIVDRFWMADLQFLSDCLHAPSGQPAAQAVPDDALRPNQLLAITLGAVNEQSICQHILTACQELLVPGAIRSLADRPVRQPLQIVHNAKLINDPYHPYQGHYTGDEDTQRKPAYHNGTAWTWLFPSYCEAWAMTYGEGGKKAALAWLSSSMRLLEQGCVGHIPEILDGDRPHAPRGCDAQAWGASELLRVWLQLTTNPDKPDPKMTIKSLT
jgi:predicted glycogen debranching enzyme